LLKLIKAVKFRKRLSWQWMMRPVLLMSNLIVWRYLQARCRFGIGI